jgi:hypothetical protein
VTDPHDVEGRKWFRRVLIAVCVAGYAVLLWQSIAGVQFSPMTERDLEVMREGCSETLVPVSAGVTMVQYECRK